VLGGSQGAQPINEALMRLVERGLPLAVRIVHQSGTAHVARVSATYEACGVPHEVASFFHDMPDRYRTADLIVSRAGATTLAEIACAGKPSVLVPYPHAADNHQWHNAKAFADAGAAALVLQDDDPAVTAEELSVAISGFLCSRDRAAIAEAAVRKLARPEAAQRVVEEIRAVTRQGEGR
jgi:UDP-N-acetylglucosamine--N-acetylmuramyl-(pentapeptide) pyrophosphoryl-undecaprenol N-acetylglucosamine transferase